MAARSMLFSTLCRASASLVASSACVAFLATPPADASALRPQATPAFPSGLELMAFGWEGAAQPLWEGRTAGAPPAVVEGQRIRRSWTPVLEEWAFPERGGIEHGFSLLGLPSGGDRSRACSTPWVALELAVSQGHAVLVDETGRHASIQNATGMPRFTYTDLLVLDGDGRELPAYLEPTDRGLRIVFNAQGAVLPIVVDPLFQDVYVKSSAPDPMDRFGRAVAAFGDRIAFGAPGEASSATGVGGSASNNSMPGAGAVYVFRFVGGAWAQEAFIKASNTDAGDGFGTALALGPDILVVGAPEEASSSTIPYVGETLNDAPGAGAAYVFRYDPATM
ncbi:MAG: hypothetical protein AAGG01_13505, partial [Planctomycetota bacterium]